MISVVIPTLNVGRTLAACLEALIPAAIDGLVREVIIADAGSDDETIAIAEDAGARVVTTKRGRGGQLAAGAQAARGEVLLFLHGDTVLSGDWAEAAQGFLEAEREAAAVFTLRFDQRCWQARLVAAGAMARTRLFALPYGDQGLLISGALYEEIGGYRPSALFEDVDFVERLVAAKGRAALRVLPAIATTSAARYEKNGYAKQVGANFVRLMRYKLGASGNDLSKDYEA